jgi:serine/threonine-protein kinase
MQQVSEAPVAPSTRTDRPIPPALDQIVLECLAKAPQDRPQSAKLLEKRLGEIPGIGVWTEEKAREWWGEYQPLRAT